jgi:hypothetical protein
VWQAGYFAGKLAAYCRKKLMTIEKETFKPMTRRIVPILFAVALLSGVVGVSAAFADYDPAECEDGEWEVRPNQTLYSISYICQTSVDAMVAYNHIENPNLINTGQILLIPPQGFQVGDETPTPEEPVAGGEQPAEVPEAEQPTEEPVAPPPAPAAPVSGGVVVEFGSPVYSGDGRIAEVPINVYNAGVTQGVAGGRYMPGNDPDTPGGPQWVTLLGAVHNEIPYPFVTNEPLWHATVYTSDGISFPAYAGCVYQEEVFAQGDEPLSRVDNIWFHWETTLEGGWFDCGNAYQVKPENLMLGESGSAPLTVYLIHPRLWNTVAEVSRRISRIDLELFDVNGQSLGTVASQTFN